MKSAFALCLCLSFVALAANVRADGNAETSRQKAIAVVAQAGLPEAAAALPAISDPPASFVQIRYYAYAPLPDVPLPLTDYGSYASEEANIDAYCYNVKYLCRVTGPCRPHDLSCAKVANWCETNWVTVRGCTMPSGNRQP